MRTPDFEGNGGKAWRVTKVVGGPPDWNAFLGAYLVHAPRAHPVIKYYTVHLIHLRDIPGVKPAMKNYPEAEHEFMIFGLDPERPVPDPDDWISSPTPLLRSPEVLEQFHGLSDAQAGRVLVEAIQAIVEGRLSPDSDFRRAWMVAIAGTVAHLREGLHEPN